MKGVPRLIASLALLLAAGTGAADDSSAILERRFDKASVDPGKWEGKSKLSDVSAAGPRAPRYPGFDEKTRVLIFRDTTPGSILVKDHEKGGAANVRFGTGDTFAFEARVKPKSIGKGHIIYLMGKGRYLSPFPGKKLFAY